MKFSDYFNVDKKIIKEYGAVNISLVCDLPLFIDPMLIFQSKEPVYKKLHEDIVRYFCFLAEKFQNSYSQDEVEKYINFSEVKNNWLGFAKSGNSGSGLGSEFSNFLAKNISNIITTNGVSKGIHIEKSLLFYKGSGKDKISDMTTNLIFKFFIDYTIEFANKYISQDKLSEFECFAEFDYDLQAHISDIYRLPFIINEKGEREFVLLTPINILRKEDSAINFKNFKSLTEVIRNSIPNGTLRANIETYISRRVEDYIISLNYKKAKDSSIERIEKNAFIELTHQFPVLFDYYIKIKEGEPLSAQAEQECTDTIEKFISNSEKIIKIYYETYGKESQVKESQVVDLSAKEELIVRLRYFKHIFENCDAYKCLYHNGIRISSEDDLSRLFRLVWFGTEFDINYDGNNGRGEYDVAVSFGAKNKCLAEFKLASNSRLPHVFKQAKVYEKANCTDGSVFAIFYFTAEEHIKTINLLKELKKDNYIDESIFLIDCRNDNKQSGSKVNI